jgi:hypothetical protein
VRLGLDEEEIMLSRRIIGLLAALLISSTSHSGTTQESIKGYELFSWKVGNHWYYSLLPATNRSKSYAEITAPAVVRRDAAGLKAELEKLSRGETVRWLSTAPSGAGKSPTGQMLNVKHPSRARIKNIKAICEKLGIKLQLS